MLSLHAVTVVDFSYAQAVFKCTKLFPLPCITLSYLLNNYSQSATPSGTASKSPVCEKHPHELLRLFCEDCEVLVRRDCVLVKHRSHSYCFVDEIIEKQKESLETVTLQELEQILTSTTEAISKVENMQARVLLNNEASVAKLNDTFKQIMVIMSKRKEALLEEISQVTQDDLCPLQKQQEDLNILKEKVWSCHDFTRDTLQNGTNCEIMSARKQMLERTKHLQELHEDCQLTPVTKPSTTIFYQVDSIQEKITNFGAFIDLVNCSIEGIPETFDMYQTVTITLTLRNVKGQGLCNITDLINAQVSCSSSLPIRTTIKEVGDGEYSVSFFVMRVEKHVISIQVNGEHIANSPIEMPQQKQPESEFVSLFDTAVKAPYVTDTDKVAVYSDSDQEYVTTDTQNKVAVDSDSDQEYVTTDTQNKVAVDSDSDSDLCTDTQNKVAVDSDSDSDLTTDTQNKVAVDSDSDRQCSFSQASTRWSTTLPSVFGHPCDLPSLGQKSKYNKCSRHKHYS